MNKFIETAALSVLTVSYLSLTIAHQTNALTTNQAKSNDANTNQTINCPQVAKEELIAYSIYCETRIIGGRIASCCVYA